MARELAWTEIAWRDLALIADYIAADSPSYAAAFVRRVRDRAGSLEEFSERGRMVPELDQPEVRELLVGNYRLIYEVGEETVFVLGLIHGARDLEALWIEGSRDPDR